MALVAAKCTQCSGQIEVDSTKEAGICKHCGTAFVTEKVINNYNTYVTQNITNVFAQETILWSGETSKLGCLMFIGKITLFMILLFEVIFVIIALSTDLGLESKWHAFGALQACLIMPAMIFFVMYFQMSNFKYSVTNEKISFIFGMGDNNFIDYREIVDIKVKYALYERKKKQFGTIKIKLRDKRFRPLRNHLYSIREPEKVYAIIKNLISTQVD